MIDNGLTEPEPTGLNRQDVERLFKQGRVAMMLTGPWLRGQIKSDAPNLNYGIVADPGGEHQGHLRRDRQPNGVQVKPRSRTSPEVP